MQPSSATSPNNLPDDGPSVTPQQRTQFFIFLLIGMCLVFAVSYTGRVLTKIRVDNAVVAQEGRNLTAMERSVELDGRLTYVQSDAYIEEKARGEFGMAQPGDKKVVILPQPNTNGTSAAPSPLVSPPQPAPTTVRPAGPVPSPNLPDLSLPVWRQWLALFRADP
jgi:cell division protein FtsB